MLQGQQQRKCEILSVIISYWTMLASSYLGVHLHHQQLVCSSSHKLCLALPNDHVPATSIPEYLRDMAMSALVFSSISG
jgi:hypothetical protein